MRPELLLGLALGTLRASASSALVRASMTSCLNETGVPFDIKNGTDWANDVAPFNRRLPYTPVAIAIPTNIAQIQDAVQCAVDLGIKANPKSGGHSYASFGLGGADGHLVIELDRMDKVTLHGDNTATVQAGARLGHVAEQLYIQGKRAIAHGTCPGVGISGHALHGGFGMSAHLHGLALDWMIGATVVLANTSIAHCSETENPDLFWALRGAGSSFGVVVHYEFDTFEAPDEVTYFTAPLTWNTTLAVEGWLTLQDYVQNDMPPELNMRLSLARLNAHFEGVYFGNATDLQAVLNPLLSIIGGRISNGRTVGWLEQLEFYSNGVGLNQTYPYYAQDNFYATSLVTKALNVNQAAEFVNYWATVGLATTRGWWIQVDMHGGANSRIAKVPANATAYAHRDKLLLYQFYDSVFFGSYPSDGFSFLQNFTRTITDTMEPEDWGMYINYADSQLDQDTAQSNYWRDHLPRLQDLKKELDPTEVFYYPQSIRPSA